LRDDLCCKSSKRRVDLTDLAITSKGTSVVAFLSLKTSKALMRLNAHLFFLIWHCFSRRMSPQTQWRFLYNRFLRLREGVLRNMNLYISADVFRISACLDISSAPSSLTRHESASRKKQRTMCVFVVFFTVWALVKFVFSVVTVISRDIKKEEGRTSSTWKIDGRVTTATAVPGLRVRRVLEGRASCPKRREGELRKNKGLFYDA
jgi:hypothetical protein